MSICRSSGSCGQLTAIDDMMVQAIEREFEAISDSQLVIYLTQIVLDHLLGRAYANGDLFVFHSLRNAGNDQGFLR